MSASKILRYLLAPVCLFVSALAAAPFAQAGTYPLTTCDLSSGCTAGSYGTVTLTTLGTNEVQVSLSLSNSQDVFSFGGAGQPLMFELASGTYSITNISDPLDSGASFKSNSGSMHDDGTGTWTNWISCSGCGSGTSKAIPAGLTFDVQGTGTTTVSLASFILNTPNAGSAPLYFGTEIGVPTGTSGQYYTGDVGAPSVVPLPPTAQLLGSALLAAGLLLARRPARVTPTPAHLAA